MATLHIVLACVFISQTKLTLSGGSNVWGLESINYTLTPFTSELKLFDAF